ncbi:DUF3822 family protein [Maribacter hydrothermalis]|uniref:DUF3822 domain-containing protein n=1 Tax=Maribacter hydrothermalis TaxID=1836467 RepID=A0A1B7ZC49_9FLAO|nr:DUF3822 family protein [Maribacter hydrothermalis]APQ16291.1 hypothetical protein BTR34_02555 [Maribacter hydrothermalis]OBR40140.1 hypothetical protein A9200_16835 [Maribacter hydrothermalis]
MTKKKKINSFNIADKNFKKLSIQVSLNGLSFCVADTVSHKVLMSDSVEFLEEKNPIAVKDELENLFQNHELTNLQFDEVVVVHRNILFGLVPKSLFNSNNLLEYLKFNTKVLPTDVLAFDEVENHELVNVYVPYMNINNYIYELFGEFTYMHNGTVLLQSLLNNENHHQEIVCYVHVNKNQLDITVLNQRKLMLYNSFIYATKEDFIYYLLFVLEQLDLDPKTTIVKLFGAIEEDDTIFQICYSYIKHISIFAPSSPQLIKLGEPASNSIDFTLINTL